MLWAFLIFEIFLCLVLTLFAITLLLSIPFDAPFVPTFAQALPQIFSHIQIKKDEVFFDLGSGDGRLVLEAARQGAQAYGFERNPLLIFFSRLKSYLSGLYGKAKFFRKNFFKINLSEASVIFCYLLPETMQKLERKFQKELKPGTRVFSLDFPLPTIPVEKTYKLANYTLYQYTWGSLDKL